MTMLNYLLLQMLKTLSNIVIRNENLQTISQVTVVIRLVLSIYLTFFNLPRPAATAAAAAATATA